MRKKTYEERAVQFAMSEPPERVRSVLETMRAILAERAPKPVKERKPRAPKLVPDSKAAGSGL